MQTSPPTPADSPPASGASNAKPKSEEAEDELLWLEEIESDRALSWVRARNAETEAELERMAGFEKLRGRVRAIMDSEDKIPYVEKKGSHYYNLWRDADHPRGLWRRTSLSEYRKKEPKWEVVLDVDALGREEGQSWVWAGSTCLYPKYERCMISLSRGGADAEVIREFDTVKKRFVESGFQLPEAKGFVSWKDIDTLYVGTDFGPASLTDSGYPRISKEWKRGTALSQATTIFEGRKSDVYAGVQREWDHGRPRDIAYRATTFYTNESYRLTGEGFVVLAKPASAKLTYWDDQILLSLREDWEVGDKTWPAGSLLATSEDDYLAGKREFVPLFTPSPTTSLNSFRTLRTKLLVNELKDVHSRLYLWERRSGKWQRRDVETPKVASLRAWALDEHESDDYWIKHSGFITPPTLELQQRKREVIKRSPDLFDAAGLEVAQHFATSKDGTRIPYFQISRKGLTLDGNNPTVMTGYGGFEIALTPRYSPVTGAAWLERGGVYILANIRGGGEYGPRWHQAALKESRTRAYDDFAAVAEDLIVRKVTRPEKLGIKGASNGGLLVGVMLTSRPDLFGAVVCKAPLLDMKRYHKLLAGASWMGEYGNPDDPKEWRFISEYSPYQNIVEAKDKAYPRTLFLTSTRDDRVHPGHARKMAARLKHKGHDVLFYENIEGGHSAAADSKQAAHMQALSYEFLAQELGLEKIALSASAQ